MDDKKLNWEQIFITSFFGEDRKDVGASSLYIAGSHKGVQYKYRIACSLCDFKNEWMRADGEERFKYYDSDGVLKKHLKEKHDTKTGSPSTIAF